MNETFCVWTWTINGGQWTLYRVKYILTPSYITNCTRPWICHVHHVLWWTKQRLMWPKTWPDSKAIKPRPVGSVASCCVNCVQITWGHLSWPYLWRLSLNQTSQDLQMLHSITLLWSQNCWTLLMVSACLHNWMGRLHDGTKNWPNLRSRFCHLLPSPTHSCKWGRGLILLD